MRQYLFLLRMLLLLLCLTDLSVSLAELEKKQVHLAYLENGLSELKNNEKQVALQLLANELIKIMA